MENMQLLENIGKTKTRNLMDDIKKQYFELKQKTFPDSKNPLSNLALIDVTDPNDTEIKSLGMSCVNDLITQNMLVWLQGVMSGSGVLNMVDFANVAIQMQFNANDGNAWTNLNVGTGGTRIQVGSGVTAPNKDDYNIETAFPSAPESLRTGTTDGVYSVGLSQATCSATISPTTDAGTINEAGFFGNWKSITGSLQRNILLTHDVISPAVSFLVGQSINIDYTFQI